MYTRRYIIFTSLGLVLLLTVLYRLTHQDVEVYIGMAATLSCLYITIMASIRQPRIIRT